MLLFVSCTTAKVTPPPRLPNGECPAGTEMFFEGCGGEGDFESGCYEDCNESGSCKVGTCTLVTIDPCARDVCDACGSQHRLCL